MYTACVLSHKTVVTCQPSLTVDIQMRQWKYLSEGWRRGRQSGHTLPTNQCAVQTPGERIVSLKQNVIELWYSELSCDIQISSKTKPTASRAVNQETGALGGGFFSFEGLGGCLFHFISLPKPEVKQGLEISDGFYCDELSED